MESSESEPDDPAVEADVTPEELLAEEVAEKSVDELKWTSVEFERAEGDMRQWRPMLEKSPRRSGPFHLPPYILTPGTAFKLFLPDTILAKYAATTTAVAAARFEKKQEEAKLGTRSPPRIKPSVYTAEDVRSFVLANFLMGVVQLPRQSMYWVGPHASPKIAQLVSSQREFVRMAVDFHFVDVSLYNKEEQVIVLYFIIWVMVVLFFV